ncbi:MAG: class GN sortase, partial [Nitrospira sp.]
MSRLRPGSRLLTMLMAGLLAIGCWQLGEGSWIYAKAGLAQFLLQRAWCRALAGEAMPKPWPWA